MQSGGIDSCDRPVPFRAIGHTKEELLFTDRTYFPDAHEHDALTSRHRIRFLGDCRRGGIKTVTKITRDIQKNAIFVGSRP